MSTIITEQFIQSAYDRVLAEVSAIAPMSLWAHQPTGLAFATHKTKYGMASSSGAVLINRAFIGTTALNKLDHTLRHEFAHLIVGIKEHHNSNFRRLEARLNLGHELDLTQEEDEIKKAVNCKYTLIAHLINDTEVSLGGASRRTKRYTDYPAKGRLTNSINGVLVKHFEYRETI